ncbi:DUF397 domain-containing protein [Streptomyces sp. BI20]|uniref:DUF397 domain-containing protein n=1 Tax=Streptomyces sp. BI20 TaxID=3403460 RepID=UPI003C76A75A
MHMRSFITSSYSKNGADTECVAVAADPLGAIAVRDSKRSGGPTLLVTDRAWRGFVAGVAGRAEGA